MQRVLHTRAAALATALALCAGAPRNAGADAEPRLVLLIVVDQLRRDALDAELPGGLGRIAREGRVYADAALAHASTATCPGHAAAVTGRHPGPAGVPGNSFIDRASGESVYCVEDPESPGLGGGPGRSPRLLRSTSLGDWMKEADPATRVFSVAGKDRSAVVLGGKRADAAYWFGGPDGFTTSSYYRAEQASWLRGRSFDGLVPEVWRHESVPAGSARPDDYFAESPEFSRTSGHPLRADNPDGLRASPFLDTLTLDLGAELVAREGLGRDDAPDLLAIGLSATDTIGHLYGPESHEARDARARLDADLGRFLDRIEREVGAGRTLLALTSDHGVLPLPEWLDETGRATCPVDGGRVDTIWLALGLWWDLHRRFSLLSWPERWAHISGSGLTVNRRRARERGVPVADVVAAAERYLESHDAIAQVWIADEIRTRDGPLAALYRNAYDPERSGDLLIQVEHGCLLSTSDHGTGHGSPYAYDRDVPIAFWGPGVPPGTIEGPAFSIDVAPTLASQIGVATPADLDGRPLY